MAHEKKKKKETHERNAKTKLGLDSAKASQEEKDGGGRKDILERMVHTKGSKEANFRIMYTSGIVVDDKDGWDASVEVRCRLACGI